METNIHFLSYLPHFFLAWEMFPTKVVEKIKTHFSVHFSPLKSFRLWVHVEEYCRGGQATYDNLTHAHCMLVTWGYKHALRICNTYCFSSATLVARRRLAAALYVGSHGLSCKKNNFGKFCFILLKIQVFSFCGTEECHRSFASIGVTGVHFKIYQCGYRKMRT